MNRNNKFRWALVVFLTAWAIYSFYPPTGRPLIEVFTEQASNKDTNFTAIVERARKETTSNQYLALQTAIGTNDVSKYFPGIKAATPADYTRAVLNKVQRAAAGKVRLGLDLQGGTSFLVGVDTSKATSTNAVNVDRGAVLEQAIEVLRKRVDKFGVAEPILQPQGDNRILIQLPGLSESDINIARETIEKAAYLEFRLVHPESDQLIKEGLTAPGYERLLERRKDPKTGQETVYPWLVKKGAERGLTGKYVDRAFVSRNQLSNTPEIILRFNSEGADKFGDITKANVGRHLAIVLDGNLESAPRINEPITGGSASISGSYDIKEAYNLANVLENPLEAPVKIEEQRGVGPSLGADSIRSGVRSAIIGVAAVAVFMLVYYMIAGAVANVALLVNLVILLGVLCSIGTTLTLPGIAGMVLTAGMAVDANVLIYERLREELAAGKSMRGAIAAGYSKAFSTIFDSHVTTLISSIILWLMGTGPIKGFGVTLTIGVAASLFTALVVTRLLFDWMLKRDMIKTIHMLHLVKGSHIDFMKLAKPAFVLSWAIIFIGLGWGVKRGHSVMGVDFAGGAMVRLSSPQPVDVSKVRSILEGAKLGEVTNTRFQGNNVQGVQITVGIPEVKDQPSHVGDNSGQRAQQAGQKVEELLMSQMPEAKFGRLGIETVGASVGAEILNSALKASLLAMLGILVYVAMRYEFSFAVGAIVAIIHDILMTMGCFFLSGRELNAPIVAAILTIIGFSINDTIVIFDRIREDLKMGVRGTFREIMNQALNQTLSRTIITSGTVFLATMSLYLFGGGVINDFAFTFLVGILTGTYSSIYIASALVLWWHKGERPKLASSQVAIDNSVAARV
ncbi:MAG TPA: protein translocase subunit SecD [Verrucomicrobiae bacterium]